MLLLKMYLPGDKCVQVFFLNESHKNCLYEISLCLNEIDMVYLLTKTISEKRFCPYDIPHCACELDLKKHGMCISTHCHVKMC